MAAITGLVKPLVDAPPVAPIRYGIFAASRITELQGEEAARLWGAGYSYLTDHCGGGFAYDDTCAAQPEKDFVEGSDLIEGDPFRVAVKKHCGPVGRTQDELRAGALQQLFSAEQSIVESVMWDGGALAAHTPTLTGSAATVVTPLAAGAGAAIAALEQAGYDMYGYQGVIHLNTAGYAALAYANLLNKDGIVWRTQAGSAVSFGSGYGITGPDDVAPAAGSIWAFMTSQTDIRRTTPFVPPIPETFDRINNQYVIEAIRAYAFTWDCPEVFAVEIPIAAPAIVDITVAP